MIVHRFGGSFSHICDWWRSHRLSARWSAWSCVLRKGVTCKGESESGSCGEALTNHGIVSVED